MEQVFKVGLVGFGKSAEVFHGPYITANPQFKLDSVYERTPGRAAACYPDIHTVERFEALLERDVDVVVLCVPNALHFPMAKAALAAGKHVVVEKPLTPTAAEGAELFRLAEEAGKVLTVYQNRRFDGELMAARELLESGTLGEVLEWESHFDRWAPQLPTTRLWKEQAATGIGAFYDLGSHLADSVISLFGAPEAVWGDLTTEREGSAIHDEFLVCLCYPHMRATLRGTNLAADGADRPRLIVRCRKGAFTVWGGEDDRKTGYLTQVGPDGRERYELAIPENHYSLFYDHLYETLAHGAPPLVTREQAVALLRVLEGATESAETGVRVTLAGKEGRPVGQGRCRKMQQSVIE